MSTVGREEETKVVNALKDKMRGASNTKLEQLLWEHQSKLEELNRQLADVQMEKYDLLIWDDFGLQPMDDKTRLAMLQILEERYERKSVIIASQLPIAKWYDYIGDPTLADAIMEASSQ